MKPLFYFFLPMILTVSCIETSSPKGDKTDSPRTISLRPEIIDLGVINELDTSFQIGFTYNGLDSTSIRSIKSSQCYCENTLKETLIPHTEYQLKLRCFSPGKTGPFKQRISILLDNDSVAMITVLADIRLNE